MILLYDRFYVEQQSPFLDHNGLTAMLWRCSVDVYDTINLRTSFGKGSYEFGLMRVEGDGYARLMCRKEQNSFPGFQRVQDAPAVACTIALQRSQHPVQLSSNLTHASGQAKPQYRPQPRQL